MANRTATKISWVLVANSAQARIFRHDGDEERRALTELEGLVHAKSRFHGKDITTDKAGSTRESAGRGMHATEPQVSPKRQEAITFAKEVAQHLEKAAQSGSFDQLYILADPGFLGLLRPKLGSQSVKKLLEERSKDVVRFKPEEIREMLPYIL